MSERQVVEEKRVSVPASEQVESAVVMRVRPQQSRGLRAYVTPYRVFVWVLRMGVLVAFLGLWEFSVRQGWLDPFFVSRPGDVWGRLVEYFETGSVWHEGRVTLQAVVLGFVIGSVAGVAAGVLFSRFPLVDDVMSPFLSALNATPRVALAPLFILWFGIGPASKVWFAVSLVFFIVLIATEGGLKSVDREHADVVRVLGATEMQRFRKVVLPSSVPAIFAGLRLGVVYSLLAVVFGEMLASTEGLGHQISVFSGAYRPDGVLATVIILASIAIVLNAVTLRVERWLLRWQ